VCLGTFLILKFSAQVRVYVFGEYQIESIDVIERKASGRSEKGEGKK